MAKVYTQAPLPFMGQKRRWRGDFKTALQQFGDCNVFIDLFGGSGLLSRFAKDARPDAVVVYNDFDGYSERIEHIGRTNTLMADLRTLLKDCPRGKMLREPHRSAILRRLKREEEVVGFVDYITLSGSLLFAMNYATSLEELEKLTLYNTLRQSDFDAAGYLDGLTVVRQDYRALFDRWRRFPNVCFLIDPPYLSTETGIYSGYWKLKDYLDVLYTLKDTSYFYFTSDKSGIVELFGWLEANYAACNPFHGSTRVERKSRINHNSVYTDIMIYKKRRNQ